MKKILVILTVFTVLFFTGCGMFSKPGISKPGEKAPQQQAPAKEAPGPAAPESGAGQPVAPEYTVLQATDTLPAQIAEAVGHLQKQRGYFVFNPRDFATGEDVYLLISAGEKPTGGYLVDVKAACLENGVLEVSVAEKEPGPEEGVIQVITYPLAVVKMTDLYERYSVRNQDNRQFAEIAAEKIPQTNHEKGIYIGQIDSNFIEIEVDGAAKAFMLAEQGLVQGLHEGGRVSFTYFKDEYGHLVVQKIDCDA